MATTISLITKWYARNHLCKIIIYVHCAAIIWLIWSYTIHNCNCNTTSDSVWLTSPCIKQPQDAPNSTRIVINVYCCGCRMHGEGNHPFKGFVVTARGTITKSLSSRGLTYHLKMKKNWQCKLLYKNENSFNKQTQKFDYSSSILATSIEQFTVRHTPLELGLSMTINGSLNSRIHSNLCRQLQPILE